MNANQLIRLAVQHSEMKTDPKIAALEKRIATLEATVAKLTPPKEEPLPEMTEEELSEWAKKAAAAITHVTVYDSCSKCDKTLVYERPCGVWKHKVTCQKCGHEQEKTMF